MASVDGDVAAVAGVEPAGSISWDFRDAAGRWLTVQTAWMPADEAPPAGWGRHRHGGYQALARADFGAIRPAPQRASARSPGVYGGRVGATEADYRWMVAGDDGRAWAVDVAWRPADSGWRPGPHWLTRRVGGFAVAVRVSRIG